AAAMPKNQSLRTSQSKHHPKLFHHLRFAPSEVGGQRSKVRERFFAIFSGSMKTETLNYL
ncbi:MAG: hypothetical protein ACI9FZ_001279, partial [Bacteroidia bacterium]